MKRIFWLFFALNAFPAIMKMIGRVMSVYSLSLQMMMFGFFLGAWVGTIVGNTEMILAGVAIYAVINFGVILTSRDLRKL